METVKDGSPVRLGGQQARPEPSSLESLPLAPISTLWYIGLLPADKQQRSYGQTPVGSAVRNSLILFLRSVYARYRLADELLIA